MATRRRAIVVGGSIGGLTAALVLQDLGWDVDVCERTARTLESQGAGIVLHPSTLRPWLRRGPRTAADFGGATARMLRYIGPGGETAHEQPCDYKFASYAWIHRRLLAELDGPRYHLDAAMVGFEQSAREVTVTLHDGTSMTADLLVCADGIHSTGRQRLLPEAQPAYSGYVGWRGTVDEAALRKETYRSFDQAISYHVMPESHLLTYPIPDAKGSVEPGERLTNWVWYRNAGPEALHALLTDRHGHRHELSIGPGSIVDEHVEALRRAADEELPPSLAEMVRETASPFVQVVVDIEVPRMAFGRVCLVGDAAFVVRPHLAVGAAKAAEDTWKLGESIGPAGDGVEEVLRRWEPGQLALGRAAVARAREAGARSQFLGTWSVGDPLPFGLYEVGDSFLADDFTFGDEKGQ